LPDLRYYDLRGEKKAQLLCDRERNNDGLNIQGRNELLTNLGMITSLENIRYSLLHKMF
jgi:hypothetical protein